MILYLGLDPSRYLCTKPLLHYPVIRTEKMGFGDEICLLWSQFTHVIFTSQTAVSYWFEEKIPFDKQAIAIGRATARQLEMLGILPIVAEVETQEGVIALLEKMDLEGAFVFWPRSKRARPVLTRYLQDRGVFCCALDLYDTVLQKLEPVPDLKEVEEIVFTSPSTVEGFLRIYGELPTDKILRGVGPITRQVLESSVL